MRIFHWLFGKRETPTAATEPKTHTGEGQKQTPASNEQPAVATNPMREASADPQADNLRRWRESGQPWTWVEARRGQWDHDAWLGLLDDLKRSSFWPMNPDAVGLVLEETRQKWLSRK